MSARTESLLRFIYDSRAADVASRLDRLIDRYREHVSSPDGYRAGELPLNERDAIMTAYGESLHGGDGSPLAHLLRFLDDEAEGVISGVHLLPFSSGIDSREVDHELGDWADIEAIADDFMLMADLVPNDCSVQGPWFQSFLRDEPPYNAYFVTASPDDDLSEVVRPCAHPLLTRYETAAGARYVWTTFSPDRVDLDYSNPDVLIEMLDVFLGYIVRGARAIRLGAIAYLWKEIGTPCVHHPKTHAVVKLMRAVVDEIAPWVVIVADPNDPHQESPGYFGSGDDEAHLVYNVALPPLVLDAFLGADSATLSDWARDLHDPGPTASFFNLLSSHDAIAPTLLPDSQRARIFLAAQSIVLALAGVPGIDYHSLTGSEGPHLSVDELSALLNEPGSLPNLVFDGYKALLRARAGSDAFSPAADQRVLAAPAAILALLRTAKTGGRVLCLVNVTGEEAEVSFTDGELGLGDEKVFRELVTDTFLYPSRDDGNRISLVVDAYEVLWLAYAPDS